MILEDDSTLYVVMEIGCLECGVPSSLIGIFQNASDAIRVRNECKVTMNWRYGGDNAFKIFKLKAKDMNVNLFERYHSVRPPNEVGSTDDDIISSDIDDELVSTASGSSEED